MFPVRYRGGKLNDRTLGAIQQERIYYRKNPIFGEEPSADKISLIGLTILVALITPGRERTA